ncbi:MAG: hypothetical protein ACP5NE_00905 [Candidatus Micrarchaeia archaeon]
MTSSFATKNQDSNSYSSDVKSVGMVERALRNISYGDWRLRIPQQAKIKLVEAHLAKMEDILPGFKYDYHSMDKFISSINMLQVDDAKKFVRSLESIAYFYSKTFDKDAALLIVTGLLSWPGSVETAERHRQVILRKLSAKSSRYKRLLYYYDRRLTALYEELEKSNSGIFRFIKKKRSAHISKLISTLEPKYSRVKEKFGIHSEILGKVVGEAEDSGNSQPVIEV